MLIKLPLAMPACHFGVSVQVPVASILIQFPANGKVVDTGSSAWAPAACVESPVEF